MKNIFYVLTFLITALSFNNIYAQCCRTSSYGSATVSSSCGNTVTITTCQYATERATINGITAGRTYRVSSSNSNDWVTIRSGSTSCTAPVVYFGPQGGNWVATVSGTYYAHFSTNSSCGNSTSCRTTSVTTVSGCTAPGGCNNSSSYGSASINSNGNLVTISTCSYAGEYSTIFGAVAGQTLRFTSSTSTDYITIRSGSSSGPIIAQGNTPLVVNNTYSGTLYAHWNTNSSCGTQSSCRTTTVQCTSCTPSAPDPCASISSLTCGTTSSYSLTGSTGAWNNYGGPFSTPGDEQVFSFTPTITGVHTINLSVSTGYVDLFYKANSCSGSSGWNYVDDIIGSASNNITLTAGVTYYFLLDDENTTASSGSISITCPQPAPNPCSNVINIASCGVSQNVNITQGDGVWSSFGGPFTTPGRENIFTFTPTATASYPITVTNNGSGWIDLFVKTTGSGCNNSGWTYIDDISGTATNNVTLTAGVTYYFLLDDEDNLGSTGSISIGCPCFGLSVDGSYTYNGNFTISGNTSGACDNSALRASEDLIYEINISCNGTYTFQTCGGASWDTYLYLTNLPGGNGSIIAFNDDNCGLQSGFTVALNAGKYYLVVEGFSSTSGGAFTASVSGTGSAPSISGSASNVSCNGGNNGSITATVDGNGNNATATLNGSAFNGSATGLSAGTYTLSATNCWGTSSQSFTVSEPTVLSASSASGSIACNGGSTAVTVSATGGTAPYSGTGSYTVTAGTYSYTVTDANGCSSTTSITVSEPTLLTASNTTSDFNGFGVSCNGGSNGTITVSAAGGTAPYSATGAYSNLSAGTYSYTVTDANGCTASTSVTITEPTDLVSAASAGTILCFGESTNVGVSATGGVAPYSGTGNFVEVAGTYNYTVTDANGCTDVASVSISQPDLLVASSSSGSIACFGGSTTVTVTATGGTAPYVNTGNYSVTAGTSRYVIQDANGCTALTTITVTEPTLLEASYTAGTIACYGATAPVTVSAIGGTEPYSGTGTFNTPAGATTYTVTDANGCTSSVMVRLSEPTQVRVYGGADQRVYFGYGPLACATMTASASGGTGAITYQWFDGNGNLVSSGSSATVCPSATTIYTVVATDANGCTASDEVAVCVTDVRCSAGNSSNFNVEICTRNGRTLCVNASSVPAHLRNGASLGSCAEQNCTVTAARELADQTIDQEYSSDKAAGEMLDVQMFPNPTSSYVNISINAPEQVFEISVFDAMGRLVNSVKNQTADRNIVLNLTDLPSGIYMVRISGEAGFIVKQIVRE